ncbi:Hint domain-containing protein [Loktanella sp. DSM 29012]|uniref:Hint domain-containing protein n=1 Tax=Loktanella sp. DSM 29012 TaxID=1881056 RepID=UPI0008C20AF0|nr:Hint domain-containing protein [Loktanella sp. DSM 29012]SEP75567.1 Hint domain-containing protein [Loktanella sp. DSM 29012]
MRRYEIVHLTPSSDIDDVTRIAPAIPLFEDCFAAIGRGAIVTTDTGPCAVEDLWPGDRVMTTSHGMVQLLWKGCMQIVPGAQNANPEMGTMTRLTQDALGYRKPNADLVLGPAARIAHRHNMSKRLSGDEVSFIPARDFIDQSAIVELHPATAVDVYQLGFREHASILISGGLEVESLHPGLPHLLKLRNDGRELLMSMFPHMQQLGDFGPLLHPRLHLRDLDLSSIA